MNLRGFKVIKAYQEQGLEMPKRKTMRSAGYDFSAAKTVELLPGKVTLVPTGIKAYMQSDEYLGIHIRSGLALRHTLSLINGQGIIDCDYYDNPDNEGHIMIAIVNHGAEAVTIEAGTRIAQGVFYKYLCVDQEEGSKTQRTGGFGSTGE
jgi:dUTP pyrophosphatase